MYLSKRIERERDIICTYPRGGHSVPTFNELGLLILDNSVGNINTAKSLHKSNLLADEKAPHHLGQVVICVIQYIFIACVIK